MCYVVLCAIQVARGVCNFYCSVLLCHVMGCSVECSAVYDVVKCNVERIALYNAMQCIVAACIVEFFSLECGQLGQSLEEPLRLFYLFL